jgi:DNA-binding IclR family transcriptional regulator
MSTPSALPARAGTAALSGIREVKSAARTVEVLEFLAARRNRPVTIRELCSELSAPRSSIYALLRTLTDLGWVRTDPTRSMYSIGIRALLAGTTYLDTDPLLRIVQPHLEELGKRLGETVHYGRLDGSDIVYLATQESPAYERKSNRVGRRLPAYATSLGKAVLANLGTDVEAHLPEKLLPLTHHTITSRRKLKADLEASRKRGYAVDNEENTLGLRCFGVELDLDDSGGDALSCSVPLDRLSPPREQEIVNELLGTATVMRKIVRSLDGLLG